MPQKVSDVGEFVRKLPTGIPVKKRRSPITHRRRAHKRRNLKIRATTVHGRPPLRISKEGFIVNFDELYQLHRPRRIRFRRIRLSASPIADTDASTAYQIYQTLEPELVDRPTSPSEIRQSHDRFFVFRNPQNMPIGVGQVDGNAGIIRQFGVSPQFRRRGYGLSMLHNLENYIYRRGHHSVAIWVRKPNTAMQNMIQRMGYERTDDETDRAIKYKKTLDIEQDENSGTPLRMEKV